MDALQERMCALVAQTRREIEAEAQRLDLPTPKLRPHPPALPALVESFERNVQLRLPPSYRAFLALHDGYEGLAHGGDLLPLASLLPGGAAQARIIAWKRQCADYGSVEVLDGIVIASTRQPNQWLYIDPNAQPAGDEFPLVLWMGDTMEIFVDLFDYLKFVIEICRDDTDTDPDAS
jgi:cell wall assembly regulator SMI1